MGLLGKKKLVSGLRQRLFDRNVVSGPTKDVDAGTCWS